MRRWVRRTAWVAGSALLAGVLTTAAMPVAGAAPDDPPLIEVLQADGLDNPRFGNGLIAPATGDVDGDGLPDVVALANANGSAVVGVAPGRTEGGVGTMTAAATVPGGTGSIYWGGNVRVADVTGSDALDVVVAHNAAPAVYVLEGDGAGSFAAPVAVTTTFPSQYDQGPGWLWVTDLDSDGNADLVSGGNGPNWNVSLATAKGVWGPPQQVVMTDGATTDAYISASAVVDVDGDGDSDLVAVGQHLWVHRNDGTGTLGTGERVGPSNLDWRGMQSGDFDGDGDVDLLRNDPWDVELWTNDGTGAFTRPASATVSGLAHFGGLRWFSGPTSDLDGDSKLDAIMVAGDAHVVSILHGDGAGGFGQSHWGYGDGAEGVNHNQQVFQGAAVADLDQDGFEDLVIASGGAGGGGVSVLRGDPLDPERRVAPEVYRDTDTRQFLDGRDALVVTDVDRDGDLDALYQYNTGINGGPLGIRYRPNDGTGRFGAPIVAGAIPGCPLFAQLLDADFDDDGNPDIACSSGTAGVAFNNGSGQLVDGTGLTVNVGGFGGVARDEAVADFDADGHPDLVHVVTNNCCPYGEPWLMGLVVNLYNPDQPRTFVVADPTGIPLGSGVNGPGPVAAGDFDGDGRADLVATRAPDGERARFFPGNGDGTFGAEVAGAPGIDRFEQLEAADVDGDGRLDLVGNTQTGPGVQILLGNGDGTFDAPSTTAADTYSGGFVREDFNGDGLADFAGTGWQSGIVTMPGRPDGTFGEVRHSSGTAARQTDVAAGDVDGDGAVDLLSAQGAQLVVLTNTSIQVPPQLEPNLQPTSIAGPAALEAGEVGDVTYTVANTGGGIVGGAWIDRIYVSEDDVWDPTDRLFFSVARTGDLPPSAVYSQTVTAAFLPERVEGAHHLIVRTDLFDQIDESDQADNTKVTPNPIDIQIPDLVPGAPQELTLGAGELRFRKLAPAAGLDQLVEAIGPVGAVTLVARDDRLPTAVEHDHEAPDPDAPRLLLPEGTGPRYVLVEGRAAAGAGSTVTLTATDLDLALLDVSPERAGNRGPATVTVHGAGFGPDLVVHLVDGSTDLVASSVSVLGSTAADATFDLDGVATGTYDVVVQQGDASAALAGAVTVTDDGPGVLEAHITAPGAMRVSSIRDTTITVRNTGGSDLGVPLVRLTSPDVLFRPGPPGTPFLVDDLALFPRQSTGPSVSVPPFSEIELTVPFALGPEAIAAVTRDGSTELDIRVDLIRAEADYAFDLGSALAPHRPVGLSDSSWRAMVDAIGPDVETWGDYVRLLGSAEREAAAQGTPRFTEPDLLDHLVARAAATAPGASLAGRVTLPDGAPASGATVVVESLADGSVVDAPVWPDGSYAARDLGPGAHVLNVDGYLLEAPVTVQVPSTGELRQDLLVTAGEVVKGFVTDGADGRPVAGADVTLADAPTGRTRFATTDDFGHYRFEGARPGTAAVSVDADAYAPVPAVDVAVIPGVENSHDVVVTTGGSVSGIVRGPAGLPAAGATVTVETSAATGRANTTASGGDGTFTIGLLPPGEAVVTASLDGAGRATATGIVVNDGADTDGLVLQLTEPGAITGTVVDADGTPVAGAEVGPLLDGAMVLPTTTAGDGTFALTDLPAGPVLLAAEATGQGRALAEVEVTAGETAPTTLTFPRLATIDGIVRYGDGQPVEGIGITAVATSETEWPLPPLTVETDAAGRYRFHPLPTGDYQLTVQGGADGATASLTDEAPSATVDLVADVGHISGRVVGAGGTPLAGIPVALLDEEADDPAPVGVTTGSDGSYAFTVAAGGTYRPVATHPLVGIAAAAPVSVGSGDVVSVGDLAPGSATLVVEVDAPDLSIDAVAGANVFVNRAELPGALPALGVRTDVDGRARFDRLEPGTYRVDVRAPHLEISSTTVAVDADGTVHPVPLGQGHELRGTIRGSDGQPLARAFVMLADRATGHIYAAATDDTGTWSHTSLPNGTFDGWVSHRRHTPVALTGLVPTPSAPPGEPGAEPAARSVDISDDTAGEVPPLELNLVDVELTGTVRGPGGDPRGGVQVDVVDNQGVVIATTVSEADGSYTMPMPSALGVNLSVRTTDGGRTNTTALPTPMPTDGFDPVSPFGVATEDPPTVSAGDILDSWLQSPKRPQRDAADQGLMAKLGPMPECPDAKAAWLLAKEWIDRTEMLWSTWNEAYDRLGQRFADLGLPVLRLVKLMAELWGLTRQLAAQVGMDAVASVGDDAVDLLSQFSNVTQVSSDVINALLSGDPVSLDNVVNVASSTAGAVGDFILDAGAGITTRNVAGAVMVIGSKVNDVVTIYNDFKAVNQLFGAFLTIERRSGNQYRASLANALRLIRATNALRRSPCEEPDPPPPPKPGDPTVDQPDPDTWVIEIEHKTFVYNSRDPNAITGPTGVDAPRWVAAAAPLDYEITFENDPAATAPAAEVVVTQTLDPDVDLASFELGDLGWGDVVVDVPDGRRSYATDLPLGTTPYSVRVEAALDLDTRVVTWRFRTIDPQTGDLPLDPLVGFLAPNVAPPVGEGWMRYTVDVAPDTPAAATVDAQASIVFDTNDPIATDTWSNAIDVAGPVARPIALPAESPTTFSVDWSALDDGAGIARYHVQVAVDGGAPQPWLRAVTETSATFTGEVGRRYTFSVWAADRVGHLGLPAVAGATTLVVGAPGPTDPTAPTDPATPTTAHDVGEPPSGQPIAAPAAPVAVVPRFTG